MQSTTSLQIILTQCTGVMHFNVCTKYLYTKPCGFNKQHQETIKQMYVTISITMKYTTNLKIIITQCTGIQNNQTNNIMSIIHIANNSIFHKSNTFQVKLSH